MSRRRARRLTVTGLVTLLVLGAAGYAAACALTPVPAPAVALTSDAATQVDADPAPAQDAVDAQGAPTAAGWLHGETAWVNTNEAVPIASISKLVTVLVALEAEPVAPGTDGPTHVWNDADRIRQEEYIAVDGVAFPVPVGTEMTTRQMLELALIPSANDFAAAYAYSVFGDNDAFLAAVEDWTARQGLDSIRLYEPTGMDERNVASPADVLQLARLALNDPTVAEITALSHADLPWGIGRVDSTNPLHGVLSDVRGVKTGRTSVAGWNLAAAQGSSAAGRDLVKLSVVLGRETEYGRLNDSIAVLSALESAPQQLPLVTEGEEIGVATTIDGHNVQLIASGTADATLVPGESATRKTTLDALDAGSAGQEAGAVSVATPTEELAIPVVTTAEIVTPDFWWKFTHPAKLFGWG